MTTTIKNHNFVHFVKFLNRSELISKSACFFNLLVISQKNPTSTYVNNRRQESTYCVSKLYRYNGKKLQHNNHRSSFS